MAFCPNCGAPAEGRFCQRCGTALGSTEPPPAYTPAPETTRNTAAGMDENVAAALCYLPFINILFLLVEPYSNNKTIRFHALQSVFYYIAWIVIGIALRIIGRLIFYAGLGFLWGLVTNLVELALLAGLIVMAVKAFQRQRFVMPFVGPMAEKQVGV